jgi:hypothetical protein
MDVDYKHGDPVRTCINIPEAVEEAMTPFTFSLFVIRETMNISITPPRDGHRSNRLGLRGLWLIRDGNESFVR